MARIIFFIFAVMCCITTGSKVSQGLPEEKGTLTGAYLYEVPGSSQMKDMQKVLPSEIEFRKDTEGLLTVTKFTSPDEIRTAVNAFLQIREFAATRSAPGCPDIDINVIAQPVR